MVSKVLVSSLASAICTSSTVYHLCKFSIHHGTAHHVSVATYRHNQFRWQLPCPASNLSTTQMVTGYSRISVSPENQPAQFSNLFFYNYFLHNRMMNQRGLCATVIGGAVSLGLPRMRWRLLLPPVLENPCIISSSSLTCSCTALVIDGWWPPEVGMPWSSWGLHPPELLYSGNWV
jgi:hypothetical protein